MKPYLDLVHRVLTTGTRKENRTGVDTLSTFNQNYTIDLRQGFPLLTTKEVSWKNIVVENLWFLSGARDIGLLKKHGCRFWAAWADDQGQVPSAYGAFWRHFPVHMRDEATNEVLTDTNDQIAWIDAELRRNPTSRRLVVSAWAPGNAQTSALPPCHAMWALNVQNLPCNAYDGDGWIGSYLRPSLCLHLTQRSADIALGVPYNIAGYALILALFARFSGIPAGLFGHSLIDAHVYTAKPDGSMAEYDHRPGLEQQLARKPRPLPQLEIAPEIRTLSDVKALLDADTETLISKFKLVGYDPHPAIPFKVAV